MAEDDRVSNHDEPAGLERRFRALTRLKRAAPKTWADAYLIAFVEAAQLTLVTFDQALRSKTTSLVVLDF